MFKRGVIIGFLALLLDQAHKYYMLYIVQMPNEFAAGMPVLKSGGRVIEVTDFFNLVMVWNKGVSFGILNAKEVADYQPIMLTAFALTIITLLFLWLRKAEKKLEATALGLVIGGALGNVIDRVVYGAVADFLDFHIANKHWPAFNIADSAISVGVFLLVIDTLLDIKRKSKEAHEKK